LAYTVGVFKLTREVRFSVPVDAQPLRAGVNGFAGNPPLDGRGIYLALRVVLVGQLDPQSSYLRNIKDIDRQVREQAVPLIAQHVVNQTYQPETTLRAVFNCLHNAWPGATVESLELHTSPQQFYTVGVALPMQSLQTPHVIYSEPVMMRLSQQFEFSAAHRLHNPHLDDIANRALFGKCNNPHGHGHNYQVQVTLVGTPDANGRLISVDHFERIVHTHAIDLLDHKHLNLEVSAFAHLNPSVENIAMIIYQMLKSHLQTPLVRLASVTVWETPKTWCEYAE
jgi:6-pyruvoyltetrahydropterin/6-carboxytetrahydropterin synthase